MSQYESLLDDAKDKFESAEQSARLGYKRASLEELAEGLQKLCEALQALDRK